MKLIRLIFLQIITAKIAPLLINTGLAVGGLVMNLPSFAAHRQAKSWFGIWSMTGSLDIALRLVRGSRSVASLHIQPIPNLSFAAPWMEVSFVGNFPNSKQ